MNRLRSLATLSSQFVNAVILGGSPDETVSGRAYRQGILLGCPRWTRVHDAINRVFLDPQHCRESHRKDALFAMKIILSYNRRSGGQ